jgi:DNA (cytosine-5)-methyltransferase 3A
MKKEYADIITERLGVQPIEINSSLVSAQNRKRLYWTNIPSVAQPLDKGIMLCDIVHELKGEHVDLSAYTIPEEKAREVIEKDVEKGKILRVGNGYTIHGTYVEIGEPGGYLFGCITPERVNKRQNGQRFNIGEKFYTLTAQDKHGLLVNGYLRRATPVEYERLQTLPDGYTEGIPETQRYKCLGNGWTVDVIAHILRGVAE